MLPLDTAVIEILKEISREAIHCLCNTSKPIIHPRNNCETLAERNGISKAPQLQGCFAKRVSLKSQGIALGDRGC